MNQETQRHVACCELLGDVTRTSGESRLRVTGEIAVQDVHNANNVDGATATRVEGRVIATIGWSLHGHAQ